MLDRECAGSVKIKERGAGGQSLQRFRPGKLSINYNPQFSEESHIVLSNKLIQPAHSSGPHPPIIIIIIADISRLEIEIF